MAETAGRTVEQVRALVGWLGAGRRLTQTGRVTLADARALLEVLDTGDRMDPMIGDRTFKTKSSEELYHLTLLGPRQSGFARQGAGPAPVWQGGREPS